MDLTRWLRGFATGSPVPVFVVAGAGQREAVQDLRLHPDLRVVDTPRAATLLIVAGEVPDSEAALSHIHDALPHPRATLLWSPPGSGPDARIRAGIQIERDVAGAAHAVQAGLLSGRLASEPSILPDVDPAPWRGIGPYGQGGTGMTGGVPYGRPLAELGVDRDGLRLDVLPVAVGPFYPRFPPGLVVDVRWAGDLVLEATVRDALTRGADGPVRPGLQPFIRALTEPVPIATLELARTREHLRWLADALLAQGLAALGVRALRLATTIKPGDGSTIDRFARAVRRTQVGRWATRGVGRVTIEDVDGLGLGPVARAAGVAEDVRTEDPEYVALGFRPVLRASGDAAARWEVRLIEATQSLGLAARAGERRTSVVGRVESPRGRLERGTGPADRLLPLVAALIRDTSWGDAVTTMVSLDLDLEESALATQLAPAAAA